MAYMIKVICRANGNKYYFHHFDLKDGMYMPRGVMAYRAADHAVKFPSIKAACNIVRLVDQSKYRLIIIPAIKPCIWKVFK